MATIVQGRTTLTVENSGKPGVTFRIVSATPLGQAMSIRGITELRNVLDQAIAQHRADSMGWDK